MRNYLLLSLPLALGQAAPAPDGTRLTPGATCYAISRGDQAIGATLQKVAAVTVDGAPAWDVVVHQRIPAMQFDLRDHFVLRRTDLTPIAFDSRKAGTEHVRVAYAEGKAVTSRPGKPDETTAFTGRIWDGNLWGLTFGALPLAQGGHFELPFYQYDKGLGLFTLDVTGSEKVGERDAWVVETTPAPGRTIRYFIGKDGSELGYAGGGFSQHLGGDCSGFPE